MMKNKKYIKGIAILLKQQMGKILSTKEHTILNSIMDSDAEFRRIATRIVDEDYLSEINQYNRDNVGERISQGVNLKINQIKMVLPP